MKIINKRLSIYDNGGKTLDRITVIDNSQVRQKYQGKYEYECISASETGSGIYTWSTAFKGKHLGKKINFSDLNKELQQRLINTFEIK